MPLWFEQLEKQKKHGIVRKGKSDTSTQNYNFTRVATFGEKYSLFIPNVTPEDSGNYECAISANVGGQNLNLGVDLTVYGKFSIFGGIFEHLNWAKHIFTKHVSNFSYMSPLNFGALIHNKLFMADACETVKCSSFDLNMNIIIKTRLEL